MTLRFFCQHKAVEGEKKRKFQCVLRITDPASSGFNRRHRRRRLRVVSFHIRHIAVYWEPRRSLVFILHCSCCCYYCSPTASAGCWTAGLRFHHTGILQQCRCRAVISFLQSAFVPAFVNMFRVPTDPYCRPPARRLRSFRPLFWEVHRRCCLPSARIPLALVLATERKRKSNSFVPSLVVT